MIADRLAKDALELPFDCDTSIITIQDIKNSSKKSIVSKWQQRWDISESGRFLKPLVDSKPYLDLPSKDLFPTGTILQIRTGYCSLKEYRYKLNQCESSLQTVSLSLSHWYPGPGVVLDCNDY